MIPGLMNIKTWGGPFGPTPDWASAKVLDLNVRGVFNLVRM
jgi:hypothetical protein